MAGLMRRNRPRELIEGSFADWTSVGDKQQAKGKDDELAMSMTTTESLGASKCISDIKGNLESVRSK